jgi:hypothetical protein
VGKRRGSPQEGQELGERSGPSVGDEGTEEDPGLGGGGMGTRRQSRRMGGTAAREVPEAKAGIGRRRDAGRWTGFTQEAGPGVGGREGTEEGGTGGGRKRRSLAAVGMDTEVRPG